MGLWQDWKEYRQHKENRESMSIEDLLLSVGITTEQITKEQALNIPTIAASVELISNTVAMLPIMLFKENDKNATKVVNDNRVKLLNDDTKDTLDGFQFKKALITDYLLNGAGYAYINKERNNIKSLHYVDDRNVSINSNVDPIFKSYEILVNGATYRDFEFIKVTRNSKDGVIGKGIIEENNKILSVVYNSLLYEELLVKTGGNKKGFLESEEKVTKEVVEELKRAWNNLYKNNTENVVVLNRGLKFQESSNTSVEMQLNENKITNSNQLSMLFNVPYDVLTGKATEEVYNNYIKICILPILTAIETALNKDLLLQSEKESFYFAFDTKDLLKGDLLKRFQAYEIASKNGFLQTDEIRYKEDLEPFGLNFIKLGLQDVLYNPDTKEIYTPNTNKSTNMEKPDSTLEGGDNIED